jgi:hypothetical protein
LRTVEDAGATPLPPQGGRGRLGGLGLRGGGWGLGAGLGGAVSGLVSGAVRGSRG